MIIKTRPEDYAEIFMPLKLNNLGKKEMLSFAIATRWSNMKDTNTVAGKEGTPNSFFSIYNQQKFLNLWPIYLSLIVPTPKGINEVYTTVLWRGL